MRLDTSLFKSMKIRHQCVQLYNRLKADTFLVNMESHDNSKQIWSMSMKNRRHVVLM